MIIKKVWRFNDIALRQNFKDRDTLESVIKKKIFETLEVKGMVIFVVVFFGNIQRRFLIVSMYISS